MLFSSFEGFFYEEGIITFLPSRGKWLTEVILHYHGKVYDSDYGYFEVKTIDPLDISDTTKYYPTSGTIIITGKNGIKLKIQFLNDGESAEVYIDTGNGYEDLGEVSLL